MTLELRFQLSLKPTASSETEFINKITMAYIVLK